MLNWVLSRSLFLQVTGEEVVAVEAVAVVDEALDSAVAVSTHHRR